jgi:hypothetical protein
LFRNAEQTLRSEKCFINCARFFLRRTGTLSVFRIAADRVRCLSLETIFWQLSRFNMVNGTKSVVILFALPLVMQAGHMYGTLKKGNTPVSGAEVKITCGTNPRPYGARTDGEGSYRVRVAENGRCMLEVSLDGLSGRAEVFSYNDPVKYDFELILQGKAYILKPR